MTPYDLSKGRITFRLQAELSRAGSGLEYPRRLALLAQIGIVPERVNLPRYR